LDAAKLNLRPVKEDGLRIAREDGRKRSHELNPSYKSHAWYSVNLKQE